MTGYVSFAGNSHCLSLHQTLMSTTASPRPRLVSKIGRCVCCARPTTFPGLIFRS